MPSRYILRMTKHLTPLEVCIAIFGSIELVAQICGLASVSPHHWKRQTKNHDAYDIPSARHMRHLLDAAAERELVLHPGWLLYGADDRDVEKANQPAARVAAE